jgi:hypothetical protein
MNKYSTKDISEELLNDLLESLKKIDGWGSVEVFIQNHVVTQITEKNIKKPNGIKKV